MTQPQGRERLVCDDCGHFASYHAGVLGCMVLLGARVSELHPCGCPAASRVRQVGQQQ